MRLKVAALAAIAAVVVTVLVAVQSGSGPRGVTFDATFDGGYRPFVGVQCSNTGTPSKPPRYRGRISLDTRNPGQGSASAKITAPKTPRGFPLTACDLETPLRPLGLGTDGYYGLMFYEPVGWTIPTSFFGGINIEEFHFRNIYGAPITWQLHPDHVTLALQTGACNNHRSTVPGCAYHSNADNASGRSGTLPPEYAIPVGHVVLGRWNELVMHVHWASTTAGSIETWYRVRGAARWTEGASITGIPTVQWDRTRGCCAPTARQETELYTGAVTSPVSVWLDNDVESEGARSSLAAVERTMP